VTVQDLTRILRDHYEDTPYYRAKPGHESGLPHVGHTATICATQSNASSVFQLRADLPVEIGALWWCAFWQPCSSCYLPIYLGAETVPQPMRFAGHRGKSDGAEVDASLRAGEAYTLFESLARWTDREYAARIPGVAACWRDFEEVNFSIQADLEQYALKLENQSPGLGREILTRHGLGAVAKAMDLAYELMRSERESMKKAVLEPAKSVIGE
jgi:dipeptidase